MKNNFKIIYLSSFFVSLFFLTREVAEAVCPICSVVVGAGMGLSRWLGVDDIISGIWIGGLTFSIILWTENLLESKNIKFKGRLFLDILFYYSLIIIPLYLSGTMGNPMNSLSFLNLDKLLFGIISGSITFWFGVSWHFYLKEKNKNKVYFPFQKVVIPLISLLFLSLIFQFLIY